MSQRLIKDGSFTTLSTRTLLPSSELFCEDANQILGPDTGTTIKFRKIGNIVSANLGWISGVVSAFGDIALDIPLEYSANLGLVSYTPCIYSVNSNIKSGIILVSGGFIVIFASELLSFIPGDTIIIYPITITWVIN